MKTRSKRILLSVSLILVILFIGAKVKRVTPLALGHHEVNQPLFSNQAINGYDAVSFFSAKKAVLGNESYIHTWNEADWYFSSEENKQAFISDPNKYAPQYGGYCSFAVSKGFTANTDPTTFEIIDDKLYLFADEAMKSNWKENQSENLKICDENWR